MDFDDELKPGADYFDQPPWYGSAKPKKIGTVLASAPRLRYDWEVNEFDMVLVQLDNGNVAMYENWAGGVPECWTREMLDAEIRAVTERLESLHNLQRVLKEKLG